MRGFLAPLLRSSTRGVLAATLCVLPAGAQKQPDMRLDTGPAGVSTSRSPRITASGNAVFAVWTESRYGQDHVHFNRSLDRGATWWTNDLRLSTNTTGAPAGGATIASSGAAVYVAWTDERNGVPDVYFNRSLDRGSTWLPSAIRLSTARPPGARSEGPIIEVSPAALYVVWRRTDGLARDLFFNRSLDRGATWLATEVPVNAGAGGTVVGQYAMGASGAVVCVAWEDGRNNGGDIYFNSSVDRGTNWLASDVQVDRNIPSGTSSRAPAIAVSGTSAYVTWDEWRRDPSNQLYPVHDVYFDRSLDAGATWLGTSLRLNTNGRGTAVSASPSIAASGTSVYVAWHDSRNSGTSPPRFLDVYFNRSLDGGASWLARDVRVNTVPPLPWGVGIPVIAASGRSVYVAWPDYRNNLAYRGDIYFNRSLDEGRTWLASDVRLDTDAPGRSRSDNPDITVSGPSVYVAWEDTRSSWTVTDVYFNIAFGYQPYGPAKPGSGGAIPEIGATGAPTLGNTVRIDVVNGVGDAAGALWIGAGPASKTALALLGGTLLVLPTASVPFSLGGTAGVPGAGRATLPLTIPGLPALVGSNLNLQAFVFDPGATFGVSMTDALEMWIG